MGFLVILVCFSLDRTALKKASCPDFFLLCCLCLNWIVNEGNGQHLEMSFLLKIWTVYVFFEAKTSGCSCSFDWYNPRPHPTFWEKVGLTFLFFITLTHYTACAQPSPARYTILHNKPFGEFVRRFVWNMCYQGILRKHVRSFFV